MKKIVKLSIATLALSTGLASVVQPVLTAEAVMTKKQIKKLTPDQKMSEGVFDAINSFRQQNGLSKIKNSSAEVTQLAQTYSSYSYSYVVGAHSNGSAYMGIAAEMREASPVKDATNYEQSFGYQIYGSTPEELGVNFIQMMFAVDSGGAWNGAHTKMMLAEDIKDIGVGVTGLGGNMYSIIVNYVEDGNGAIPFGPGNLSPENVDSTTKGQNGGGNPYKDKKDKKDKTSSSKKPTASQDKPKAKAGK